MENVKIKPGRNLSCQNLCLYRDFRCRYVRPRNKKIKQLKQLKQLKILMLMLEMICEWKVFWEKERFSFFGFDLEIKK